jgi:hypothetical protein
MRLHYQANGDLIPGVFNITIEDFKNEYGYSKYRMELISGLEKACTDLKDCGCQRIFIDGSFVTKKATPGDYDACWDHHGMDLVKLKDQYALFFDFTNARANQKAYYKGEFFPAFAPAQLIPLVNYINFFQRDREDNLKGIVELSII